MSDNIFKKIREGSDAEANKVFKNLQETALKGAVMAIITRNNSHGLGNNVKRPPPQK